MLLSHNYRINQIVHARKGDLALQNIFLSLKLKIEIEIYFAYETTISVHGFWHTSHRFLISINLFKLSMNGIHLNSAFNVDFNDISWIKDNKIQNIKLRDELSISNRTGFASFASRPSKRLHESAKWSCWWSAILPELILMKSCGFSQKIVKTADQM